MPKTQKLNKRFVLSDSSVNTYGFRLLTSGYQLSEYQRNPIGYYMHNRDGGVVLRWEDIQVSGDQVTGVPVINLSHPRAQQTIDEVENGFLNAASVGHIVALEWSDDPDHALPGQTGPTITKWYNKECSLVDIPGNENAMCLFDNDGNEIKLADFLKAPQSQNSKSENPDMSKQALVLTAVSLAALKLPETADQAAADLAIKDLADQNAAQAIQLSNLKAEKETAEKALTDLKAATTQKEVTSLLDAALAAGKVTAQVKEKLAASYGDKPTELKDLLDAMPAYTPITTALKSETGDLPEKFKGKTFMQLHAQNLLPELKEKHPAHFETLQKQWQEEKKK